MRLLRPLLVTILVTLGIPVASAAAPGETILDNQGTRYLESRDLIVASDWDARENITRAEFVEMVTNLVYPHDLRANCFKEIASEQPVKFERLFTEITLDHPLAVHLCVGLKTGIIHGNNDGSFRPGAPITVGEASQILYRAYALGPLDRKAVAGRPWYHQPMHDLQVAKILPGVLYDMPSHQVTNGEAAEMFYRLRNHESRLRVAGEQRLSGKASFFEQTSEMTPVTEVLSQPQEFETIDAPVTKTGDAPLGMVKVYARGVEWVIPYPVSRR